MDNDKYPPPLPLKPPPDTTTSSFWSIIGSIIALILIIGILIRIGKAISRIKGIKTFVVFIILFVVFGLAIAFLQRCIGAIICNDWDWESKRDTTLYPYNLYLMIVSLGYIGYAIYQLATPRKRLLPSATIEEEEYWNNRLFYLKASSNENLFYVGPFTLKRLSNDKCTFKHEGKIYKIENLTSRTYIWHMERLGFGTDPPLSQWITIGDVPALKDIISRSATACIIRRLE